MICEIRSVKRALVDRPARDLLLCQKEMSDWKAKNSNTRCSRLAVNVTAIRYTDVSEINLTEPIKSDITKQPRQSFLAR